MSYSNPIYSNNWKLVFSRLKNVEFTCTKIKIPDVSLKPVNQPTQRLNIPVWGDHVNFESLDIQFIVAENFENHKEIFQWLMGLGAPKNSSQYDNLVKSTIPQQLGRSQESDITVSILTNSGNKNTDFIFHDAFPIYLSGFIVTSLDEDTNILVANASFAYSYYDIT